MIITDSSKILLKIKTIMVEKQISQTELAAKMNLSTAALNSRLRQSNITISSLLEICNSLGLDIDIEFIDKGDTK